LPPHPGFVDEKEEEKGKPPCRKERSGFTLSSRRRRKKSTNVEGLFYYLLSRGRRGWGGDLPLINSIVDDEHSEGGKKEGMEKNLLRPEGRDREVRYITLLSLGKERGGGKREGKEMRTCHDSPTPSWGEKGKGKDGSGMLQLF